MNIINKNILLISFAILCCIVELIATLELITIIDEQQRDGNNNNNNETFPAHFQFGVSTAAHQIEGAWNIDGKSPNVWDTLTHEHPDLVLDGSNADDAANSYYFYEKDIQALKETKVNFYRFSISWSRILPNAELSSLNKIGLAYYDKLIDRLLENGIEPMVTLHHYDLPQVLQDQGGFLNPRIVEYFTLYASVAFSNFGNRVKRWITFNEPVDVCVEGYGLGHFAPLINLTGTGEYFCIDTIIKAHASAYHLYRERFYAKQNGKIGITLSSRFFFSATNDTDVVDRGMAYWLGWVANPIYSSTGGYPPIMVQDIASNSVREGRSWSRLPTLDTTWQQLVQGSADFLGLNYYTSRLVEMSTGPKLNSPSWSSDTNLKYIIDSKWPKGKSSWLLSVPDGLRGILGWIKDNYNNTEVIVTENGWSDDGEINDNERIIYLQRHLQELLKAINEDGCNVTAYTHWSIIDNFEWLDGYAYRFGLYSIDFKSKEKERIPKKSAHFYRKIIETRTIPQNVA